MGKAPKHVRKFSKNLEANLKNKIAKRRPSSGKKAKEKGARAPAGAAAANGGGAAAAAAAPKKRVEDLTIDEFLEGDFLDASGSSGSDSEGGSPSGSGSGSDSDPDLGGSSGDDGDEPGGEGRAAAMSEDSEDDDALTSSSDEDGGGGGGGVAAENARLRGRVARHRAELEALRQSDPEFYAYLAGTDAELLAFGKGEGKEGGSDGEGDDDDDDDEDEDEDDDEEAAGRAKGKARAAAAAAPAAAGSSDDDDGGGGGKGGGGAGAPAPAPGKPVTLAMVDSWCAAARRGSLAAARALSRAYRAACHYGDAGADDGGAALRLASSAVYNRVLLFMLREADGLLRRLLGPEVAAGGDAALAPAALARLPRWRKVEPLAKSYLGNTLHLLGQMTDAGMLAFVLRRARASAPFLAPYAKLQRRYLKAALALWGGAEAAPTRVQAILFVRRCALSLPPPALDAALRGAAREYAARARFVSAASAPHLAFMAACVVELYGADPAAGYAHAFAGVRSLAQTLRTALTSKSKDAYRDVYCWQWVCCAELWAKVVAAHGGGGGGGGGGGELRPLAHPVAQLLLGAARLVPTPAHFPLRLRLARALIGLGAALGLYVPASPLLLEILAWPELARRPGGGPKPGKGAPAALPAAAPDLGLMLRAGKTALGGAPLREELALGAVEALAEHLAQWACHPAFPELAHLPAAQLRKFAKAAAAERPRRAARALAEALDRNAAWVGAARDAADFAPKDLAAVGAFLAGERGAGAAPLAAHAAALRAAARRRAELRAAKYMDLGADAPGGGGDLGEREGDEVDEPARAPRPKAARAEAPQGRRAPPAAAAEGGGDDDGGDDDDDALGDYELSGSSDDD